jgi:hypothetical protein
MSDCSSVGVASGAIAPFERYPVKDNEGCILDAEAHELHRPSAGLGFRVQGLGRCILGLRV